VLYLLCTSAAQAQQWVTLFASLDAADSQSAAAVAPPAPAGLGLQSPAGAAAPDVPSAGPNGVSPDDAAQPICCDGCEMPSYANDSENGNETRFGVLPFYAYLHYGDASIKSQANIEGAYFYLSNPRALLEFNGQEGDFAYRTGSQLSQQDYTTILTLYPLANVRFRFGNHTIANDDPLRSNGEVWFAGLHYFEKERWEAGVDAYVSRYSSYTPPLTIAQITPRVSYHITPTSWVEARGYYIHSNADLGLGTENFYSAEARLSKVFGFLTLSAFGYGGNQIFAVRNDGFIVWNLAEEHHGGFGADAIFKLNEHADFTVRIADELFKDLSTQANTQVLMATFLLMYTF